MSNSMQFCLFDIYTKIKYIYTNFNASIFINSSKFEARLKLETTLGQDIIIPCESTNFNSEK